MNLRRATLTDARTIAALHAASWRLAYRGALADKYLERDAEADRQSLWLQRLETPLENQFVVVAETQRELLGFACVFANEHQEWGSLLDNIHVARAFQVRGVGTALLRCAAQWCSGQAPGSGLYLWVLQGNLLAQRFYRNLGASNVGSDVWVPPGGGSVPRYRFAWPSATALTATAANPSIERTSQGLRPCAASDAKR